MKRLALIITIACAVAFGAGSARADGVMSAMSFKAVPAGAAIAVRALDDSDQDKVLRTDFERELEKSGYKISKDASLVLTIETRDTAGSWTGGGVNRFVELSDNVDQTGIEAPRVRFNLYNSRRGGILNPDRADDTRTVTPSEFRIDVTLEDKGDGKRLWQGWSSAKIRTGDSESVSRAMVPVLVGGLGKTISHKAFPTK